MLNPLPQRQRRATASGRQRTNGREHLVLFHSQN
jgi:hypothetical protein